MTALAEKCFRGWPAEPGSLNVALVAMSEQEGRTARIYDFDSQPGVRLRLYLYHDAPLNEATRIRLSVGADSPLGRATVARLRALLADRPEALGLPEASLDGSDTDLPHGVVSAVFFPRGTSPTAWNADEKKQIQNRRRFMLLGQTFAGMQTWDVRRAMQAIRSLPSNNAAGITIDINAGKAMAVPTLYAALFESPTASMMLFDPPSTHVDGPDLLNILRFLDIPQAVAVAAERGVAINIRTREADRWRYPAAVVERLRWPNTKLTVGDEK